MWDLFLHLIQLSLDLVAQNCIERIIIAIQLIVLHQLLSVNIINLIHPSILVNEGKYEVDYGKVLLRDIFHKWEQ